MPIIKVPTATNDNRTKFKSLEKHTNFTFESWFFNLFIVINYLFIIQYIIYFEMVFPSYFAHTPTDLIQSKCTRT